MIRHINMNKKIIAILIFAAGLAIGGAGFYLFQAEMGLSSEEAGKIVINFINQNIEEGVTASLIDISQSGDIYKIHLKIAEAEYESYLTKDGKFLFPSGYNLEQQPAQESAQEEAAPENLSQEPPAASLGDFAKCLTEKGAKFYGASWCGHCQNQKKMFGEFAEFLPYIECSTPDGNDQTAVCKENNIASYPTWVFVDGSRESGELSLQKLSEKTGCQLSE